MLADALTSVLAIVALLTGKFLGWNWMDAIMGMVGAVVITRWSYGLMKETSGILLDGNDDAELVAKIHQAIETENGDRITDLHVWRVGPHHQAAIVSLVTHEPRQPEYYKQRIQQLAELSHVTVEVNQCAAAGDCV